MLSLPTFLSWTSRSASWTQGVSWKRGDWQVWPSKIILATQTSGYCQPGGMASITPRQMSAKSASGLFRSSSIVYRHFSSLARSDRNQIKVSVFCGRSAMADHSSAGRPVDRDLQGRGQMHRAGGYRLPGGWVPAQPFPDDP